MHAGGVPAVHFSTAAGLPTVRIDRPGTGKDTHSPTVFIADLAAAFKATGRTERIMDAFDGAGRPILGDSGFPMRVPSIAFLGRSKNKETEIDHDRMRHGIVNGLLYQADISVAGGKRVANSTFCTIYAPTATISGNTTLCP